MKVVFAGEQGSFAELAAMEFFGKGHSIQPVGMFEDVFSAVANSKVSYGIVPIENSRAGSVHRNYDLLLEHSCSIAGEQYLKIDQCLIVNKGTTMAKVNKVLSHPQALAQCRTFLKKHQEIIPEETVNTAAAVKRIKESFMLDAAAIASKQAAIDFDMKILAQNIQDDKNNTTRFLVLAKNPLKKISTKGAVKSSIVFSMKNLPGALFKSLAVFSLRDIDLYKIESRPIFGKAFQYLFYLDFAGNAHDEPQKNALRHLQEMTTFFRYLGTYPAGKTVEPAYIKRSQQMFDDCD